MQVVTNISYGAVPYCGAVLYNTGGGGAGRQLFNIKDDLSAGRNRHCKRGKENVRQQALNVQQKMWDKNCSHQKK